MGNKKMGATLSKLEEQLARKILILDGAMGTMLQQQKLEVEDFGNPEQEGCNEILNITRPEIVSLIHEAYLEAGADIIETNSFGATKIVLEEYQLGERDIEINRVAAQLACKAAAKWSTEDKPRFVAGSMGPTTKMLSLTNGFTFEQCEEAYYRQAKGLLEGGADLLLVETCQDTLNVKAAGIGIKRAEKELAKQVPIMISCTIEPSGTMLAGQNIEAFYISIQQLNPIAVGLNCGTGAEGMNDSLRTLEGIASCAVSCYPNAGLPDEEGNYREAPEEFSRKMSLFAQKGWLNIVGGCCGTTNEHIQALAKELSGSIPRIYKDTNTSSLSGIEAVWLEEENRPFLVGERTNVIGSRKFRDLISAGLFEEASEIARGQAKKGAQIIDICVANPDRDELQDMLDFLPHVVKKVKRPLMLDSTDAVVLEAGLKLIQGKAIINSINLENGLQRFEEVVPLIKKYGAAIVVGVIDEQGMALTRQRKLDVAKRSYDLLVNHYGINPRDIIFDPLTFPVGTGDVKYLGSAVETIEGLRLIKQEMPQCKTTLGISNVSFGLPAVGREVLNAVFVYLNTMAGLDYAIVNAEKLQRYPSIPAEEKRIAEELLLNTSDETLKTFTDFYRDKKIVEKRQATALSVEERLAACIIEGSKEGLEKDLNEALQKYTPLELINGPLMQGMEEVGRLFNQNQLIVAEVLQSAEVMKSAVSFLEPYMEKAEEAVKGKILLATVKGDVHDIGKNLVEIILSNNGYKVINLGVKVSSESLIEATKRENPDIIGLSGLLVKSVQEMLLTAQDLKEAGIDIPLILGGAALSRKFTDEKIAPAYNGEVLYAKDAMESLGLLHGVITKKKETAKQGKKSLRFNELTRQVFIDYPLQELTANLNIPLFMRRYLGMNKKLENFKDKSTEFSQLIQEFLVDIQEKQLIKASAVCSFFPSYSKDESIYVYNCHEDCFEEFTFPRQQKVHGLCLSDFIRQENDEKKDYVGLLAVTTGLGIRAQAEQFKQNGEYLKSFLIEALALELVEVLAEQIHLQMRKNWGLHISQGVRVSPGYPIWPTIEDQGKVFRLLRPEEIGIGLTDGFMMDPEASITAMVFSHPEAKIFSVR